MVSFLLLLLILLIMVALLSGYPVAFGLAGSSLLIAFLAASLGVFDLTLLHALPTRIYGIMSNDLLIAVPLFVFMGVMLQSTQIADQLLRHICILFGNKKGGLAIATMLVGALLAASTGIVGATVITMGLIALPTMQKHLYDSKLSTGTICAAGTLGQVIPPSIVLILLGDQIAAAHQTAQLALGNFAPTPISIADMFAGAMIPGLLLVGLYISYLMIKATLAPESMPAIKESVEYKTSLWTLLSQLFAPILLIVIVLGSILSGLATATESASLGAMGALLLALIKRKLSFKTLHKSALDTAIYASMVFTILIGATIFSLVFRGLGGDLLIHEFLTSLPGGLGTVLLITMVFIFLLGFFLDFIEITFVVIPIIGPILLQMGAHPVWLAILIALNLQTSFLTPPFGFSLFYLRSVAPTSIKTTTIYQGVIPFIIIQIITLTFVYFIPELATYLPSKLYETPMKLNTPTSFVPTIEAIDF